MLKLQFVTASRNAITSITNNSSRDLKKKKKRKNLFYWYHYVSPIGMGVVLPLYMIARNIILRV